MLKIVVNGKVKNHTESFGNSYDTPVLLIAGAMASAIFWNDYFCKTLASNGYYVIRFDNRDIGRSTHFEQNDPVSGFELPYSINPENTKLLAEHLPSAEFFILKGGGHMFFNKNIWDIFINRIIIHFERSKQFR